MSDESEFAETMRAAAATLRAAAARHEGEFEADLFGTRASICEVWAEFAGRVSEARQEEFRGFARKWLEEAKA